MARLLSPARSLNLKLVRTFASLSLCASLAACTTPDQKPQAESSEKATGSEAATPQASAPAANEAAPGPGGFMPACLNVVENDLRVEFDKSRLIVKDGGQPKALSLDDGEPVKCEKLTILSKAKRPSVEIVYLTRETGSSINIVERKMAVANIKTGVWVAKPITIDRLFSENDEIKTVPVVNVKWSEDQGALILTRTDIASKESETIKP